MGLSTEKFGLDIFLVFHPIHVYSIRQSSTQCRIAAACPCDVRTNPNKWIWLVIAWYNLHSVCVCVLQSPLDSIHAGHRQFVGFGRCVSTHSICGKCQCMHCQSYVWLLRLSCILLFAIQFPILHTNRVSTYNVVVPHVRPQRMKECMRGARADGTTKTWIIRLYGEYWCAPFAVDFVSPSLTHTHTHTRSSGCAARLVVHHVQMHFGFDCSTLVVAAHICICITVLLLHHILQFFGWNFVRTVSKQGHVKRAVPCAHG